MNMIGHQNICMQSDAALGAGIAQPLKVDFGIARPIENWGAVMPSLNQVDRVTW
jgi:hypothetical protein